MREKIFRFKQFCVANDKSAMKVGTDGVLLGAWCNVNDVHRVLDIGAGTGLIALMVAQRTGLAIVDAVEIDFDAYNEAVENFEASPWADRIHAICDDFNAFSGRCNTRYDLIVSNPPFFTNGVLPPDVQRLKARHCDTLTFRELLGNATKLLSEVGKICMISPYDQDADISTIARENGLSVVKKTVVYPRPNAEPKRILWEVTKLPNSVLQEDELVIEVGEHHEYSLEYIALTKDFYLKM